MSDIINQALGPITPEEETLITERTDKIAERNHEHIGHLFDMAAAVQDDETPSIENLGKLIGFTMHLLETSITWESVAMSLADRVLELRKSEEDEDTRI